MSERVTMPALGESVTEGTVTRWLKDVGDSVAIDEPLLEVSTDKVDTEIPSPVAGTLQQILVAAGGTTVTMPALGESVTEGTVTRWLKAEGDQIAVDEPLLEVSTDKVDTEIPSPAGGVLLEILVGEDETVDVGTVVARIGEASEAGAGAP